MGCIELGVVSRSPVVYVCMFTTVVVLWALKTIR